jgi:hypothetical protein
MTEAKRWQFQGLPLPPDVKNVDLKFIHTHAKAQNLADINCGDDSGSSAFGREGEGDVPRRSGRKRKRRLCSDIVNPYYLSILQKRRRTPSPPIDLSTDLADNSSSDNSSDNSSPQPNTIVKHVQ